MTDLTLGSTGLFVGVRGEPSAAPACAELANGPHGMLIKWSAGNVSPTLTHMEDNWAHVVPGVMVNKTPDGPDVTLPVGSNYLQNGRRTARDPVPVADACVFFVNQRREVRTSQLRR